jgi:uncharacterized heparinase superfamily protein
MVGIFPIGRLWRTVRWLRAEQVVGRARRLLRQRLWPTRPSHHSPPPVHPAVQPWVATPCRLPSMVDPDHFRFLGETRALSEWGWDHPIIPLLWRYNLHYFDDLCAEHAKERVAWHRALVDRWIRENPPADGTGWAPYPTSLRVVNWIKWWCAVNGGIAPHPAWVHSLAVQVRWLARNVEWHLLGNHLFANAKALLIAGLFFEGDEAARWKALGQSILLRELPEQLLADGGHFERSPMYHALATEDVLDLLNVLQAYAVPATDPLYQALATRIPDMLRWLQLMTRPDGTLVRFNDCADGIAPTTDALVQYAIALGFSSGFATPVPPGLTKLFPSGYLRVDAPRATAWMDVAPIGPDYLPGHAHADTLSCELVVDGHPVLVNRGTSVYGTGGRRQLERGTSAHNTVTLAGLNSSEVWAGFRVGRRARVYEISLQEAPGVTSVKASHTGYVHLPGKPVHHRHCQWNSCDTLLVHDEIVAGGEHDSWSALQPATVARYHLAPGLRVVQLSPAEWQVFMADRPLVTAHVQEGKAALEEWQHAVGFGELAQAWTLAVSLSPTTRQARVLWSWSNQSISSS